MTVFDYICHRRPERSFFYKGHQFPVCARCTGFYISGISTIVLLKLFPVPYSLTTLIIGIILLIPCAIDGFTQLFEFRESNNILRFITGLLGGVGLILVYELMIEFFVFNFL
ncbi:DUF2085 domain-containing protein [uncultured Methanobrevibacter sp.]|uniref:DUF2085 domain-containing protein n=1 Tax=uncultured Methanobrevibacter sp. TaxID=253161 RepID=UPI0025CE9F7A|nr:DUF2085 domain-containing protein [uncultured Methanobrevibacter sp.]